MEYPTFRTEWLAFADKLVSELDSVYNDGTISPTAKREKFSAIGKKYDIELDSLTAA